MMGASDFLRIVALACGHVSTSLTDPNACPQYSLKRLSKKGEEHFRFNMMLRCGPNGAAKLVEVQVRTIEEER